MKWVTGVVVCVLSVTEESTRESPDPGGKDHCNV